MDFSGLPEFTEKLVFVQPEFRYERCGGQGVSGNAGAPANGPR